MVPQLESEPSVCQFDEEPETAPFAIPEKWKWTKLGEIGRWKAGGTPPRSHPEYFQKGHIPWLKTGDLTDGSIESVEEYITEAAIKNSSAYINPIGSVLIAMYGATIGKLGILEFPCATNQACCACDVNTQICDRWYLFYYLLSQRKAFIAQGAGGAQPNISRTKIVNYWIPLPPLEEQIRIITKVKQLFEQIDCAEEAYNELTGALSERFRQLCLERAIQGKLVPQLESEPEVKQIGTTPIDMPFSIPSKWKWMSLSDVISEISDGSHNPPPNSGQGIPVLSAKNVNNGIINTQAVTRWATQEQWLIEDKKIHIEPGDVLLTIVGSIGRTAVVPDDAPKFMLQRSVCVIKTKTFLYSEFLALMLTSPTLLEWMMNRASGTAQKGIYLKTLKTMPLPIPPLLEQRRIVLKLKEIFSTMTTIKFC